METNDYLFKGNLPLYGSALEAYSMRQRTIAKNIANAQTPNYRAEHVRFEEEFQEGKTSLRGIRPSGSYVQIGARAGGDVQAEVEQPPVPKAEVYFSGDAHVNIDREMSELAQNQIRFRLASRLTQRYFTGLQSAIKGTTA